MVPFSVEKQKTSDGVKFFGMRLSSPKTTASNEFSANPPNSTEGNGTVSQSVYNGIINTPLHTN